VEVAYCGGDLCFGAAWNHSAMVRALEIMADHEVA